MENLSPIKQIDIVLSLFKKDRGHISFDHVITRLDIDGYKISGDILRRHIEKLIRDQYVYIAMPQGTNFEKYAITFEGFLFIGYENQLKIDQTSYQRKNVREFALTWGTVLAGIAASALLIWQIYSYNHPEPIPVNLKVQTEKKR